MNRFAPQLAHLALVAMLGLIQLSWIAGRSSAEPLTPAFVATDIDWTWAAVGGIGGGGRHGGTATIVLTGVTGPVKQAILYWHGIDNFTLRTENTPRGAGSVVPGSRTYPATVQARDAACDGVYNVPTITFDGNSVTGVPIGDAETNCWGEGSSRAFRADVTAFVPGNGVYSLSSMTADECDDVNGASLIVTFEDGNLANNHDLVFCEGNDSNLFFNFRGETDGWHAVLPDIAFTSGRVGLQLHVADGQDLAGNGLDDDNLTISADGRSVVIPDASGRYDGASVPNAGFSRSEALGKPGELWDVHSFDITSIFTLPGTYTLALDGQEQTADCTGLVLAIVDLETRVASVAVHAMSWGAVKAIYR
jgi:hypothetical protein